MAAYRAVQSGTNVQTANLVAEYDKYFTTTVTTPVKSQKFDIFSMYDPNIRVVVQSNTVTN
ncbi:MAG: hypothetical protein PHI29_01650 [Gallionella sp.]|nr:hypothetical protein [Gallionella sp.]